jgi:O-succinylbenzoate synthase
VLAVELRRLDLELVRSLSTSGGTHARRPVLIVRAETDVGTGWGECEALEAPTYTEEYADGAEQVLVEFLVPLLLGAGRSFGGAADALRALAPVRGNRMAKAALEMALLDAELRAVGESLARRLGATRRSVVAGATVGTGAPGTVVADVAEAVAAGFTSVKCKIAPGLDIAPLRAVRASFPDLGLSVDANGAYRFDVEEDRSALEALDALDLAAIEQPLAPEDLAGHAQLTARLRAPVLLDESIDSPASLEAALAMRACDGISVKAARLGGALTALTVHDRCVAAGVRLAAGGMLETGLGRAVSLAVAALPGFDLPGDLGPSERYFSPDVTAAHLIDDGALAVPDGPGIGVEPITAVLEAATVRTRTLRAI